MAFTILVLKQHRGGDLAESKLFISQEYFPTKDRDPSGAVLPNQEWRHPEASELHYCEFATLAADERVDSLFRTLVSLGSGELAGHVRVIRFEECSWLEAQIESWEDRHARTEEELKAEERRRWEEHVADMQRRQPVYDHCRRCGRESEQCKGPSHRGSNRCMQCCGGLGNRDVRHCRNCIDLPYREKREAILGEPIVYTGEEA